jgi:hypothetical protein
MSTGIHQELPKFKDLPLDPSHPPHSAWIWGPDDARGCLNHLTPERVAEAAKLVRTGVSVGLNWGLHRMNVPAPYRRTMGHKILHLSDFINVRLAHL